MVTPNSKNGNSEVGDDDGKTIAYRQGDLTETVGKYNFEDGQFNIDVYRPHAGDFHGKNGAE